MVKSSWPLENKNEAFERKVIILAGSMEGAHPKLLGTIVNHHNLVG